MRATLVVLICGLLGACALPGHPTCNGCNDNGIRESVDQMTR